MSFWVETELLHEKSREPLHDVEVPALCDFGVKITLLNLGVQRFEVGFNGGATRFQKWR